MRSASSSNLRSQPANPQIVTTASSNRAVKSHSTTNLPTVVSTSESSPSLPHDRSRSDNLEFNTLSRTPTPLSNGARTPEAPSPHHPDLSSEVAALTTKLINAINHQTNLDDSLQTTRGELDGVRSENAMLKQQLEEEKQQRVNAERLKRRMEGELEDITSSVFEESNNMVADARHELDDEKQRNEHLRSQLQNAETLLTSHQDQLRDLKDLLSQLQTERDGEPSAMQQSAPSTPIAVLAGKRSAEFGLTHSSSSRQFTQQVQPDHPLSFSHILSPVLRSDVQGFDDFVSMLKAGQQAAPSSSRVGSGNFSGLNVMGIGSLSNFSQSNVIRPSPITTPSTSSLATSSPQPPSIPGAFQQTGAADFAASPTIASSLKDQKFYKRAVAEDIEPTLRLEMATRLPFFTKRNFVTNMVSGNLIVEPYGPQSKYWSPTWPCDLCSESREEEPYVRKHRFYKTDGEDKFMVCAYCLNRLRATGDFINFLRMVRSGYWKSDSLEDSKTAWEECTKLRERMFWARMGGGVIPTFAPATETMNSPKPSRDVSAEDPPPTVSSFKEALSSPNKSRPTTAVPIGPPGRVSASGSPERRFPSPERRLTSPERRLASPERRSGSSDSTTTGLREARGSTSEASGSGSRKFLAARSRFESSSTASDTPPVLRSSRPSTPAEPGAVERKGSDGPAPPSEWGLSPPKSPRKVTSSMPGSLDL